MVVTFLSQKIKEQFEFHFEDNKERTIGQLGNCKINLVEVQKGKRLIC